MLKLYLLVKVDWNLLPERAMRETENILLEICACVDYEQGDCEKVKAMNMVMKVAYSPAKQLLMSQI